MNQECVVPTLATTSWTGSCSSDSPGHDVVMLTQQCVSIGAPWSIWGKVCMTQQWHSVIIGDFISLVLLRHT